MDGVIRSFRQPLSDNVCWGLALNLSQLAVCYSIQKPVASLMLLCPFPDCIQQKNNHMHVAAHTSNGALSSSPERNSPQILSDGIYLCPDCGRLSYQCVSEKCKALNRPFTQFCRHCGEYGSLKSYRIDVARRWSEVERFDFDWKFKQSDPSEGRESQAAHTATVLNLNEQRGCVEPEVLLEMRIIDGVLAVHQGGGFLALIHPFGDLASDNDAGLDENRRENRTVVWAESEQTILQNNGHSLPSLSTTDATWFRPFSPLATPDGRYIIFSTPYAAISVDTASLPGWNSGSGTKYRTLGFWEAPEALTQLAATPVPLTEQPRPANSVLGRTPLPVSENRIGFLLQNRSDQSWWWCVETPGFDADEADNSALTNPGQRCVQIPLKGNNAQILTLENKFIVFATEQGHWLWTYSAAVESRVESIELLGANAADQVIRKIVLDSNVTDRNFFRKRYQHIYSSRIEHRRSIESFEVAYPCHDLGSSITGTEVRQVWSKDLERTRSRKPITLGRGKQAFPLGAWLSSSDQLTELLLLVGQEGAIHHRNTAENTSTPLQNLLAGNYIDGLQFQDPLLILVCPDKVNPVEQKVELRSLRYPKGVAVVPGVSLRADPFVWSHFLFTVEIDRNKLILNRREFRIHSSGTNSHLNDREPLTSESLIALSRPIAQPLGD